MSRILVVDDDSGMLASLRGLFRSRGQEAVVARSGQEALGHSIVGDGPAMRQLLETISRLAPKDITVLIRGETGTGKELIASLMHAQSHRTARALVRFNCAAIPGDLAEAELFGHVRGAFTGASQARRGFFSQADGGTLVLDEIGELP